MDAVADAHLEAVVALSPTTATYLGLPGGEDRFDDFSPDGLQAMDAVAGATLRALAGVPPVDDVDEVTVEALTERLTLERELHRRGYDLGSLNVIESPLQQIRMTFDLMATETDDDWATIATRMAAVPVAVDSYLRALREGSRTGRVSARRQVEGCITQARTIAATDGFFHTLTEGSGRPTALSGDLERAAAAASQAYGKLADVLADELAPVSRAEDAVGRDEYVLWSRLHVGVTVDLDETYAWGLSELERIVAEQQVVAEQVLPGGTLKEAMSLLDDDPARTLRGTEALQRWMQDLSDRAVAELAGEHFDIPDPVRALECRIAPTHDGGIYYTGPSDDFSRPGRMWWAVPEGVSTFNTWRETTTVYHEGVPGHHLQIAQTTYRKGLLNRWRRLLSGNSGHWEGWALYAERMMADLGYLDDPGDMMGMLDGQRLRAARVVLDIGVHLGLPAPQQWGGGTWTAAKTRPFLLANAQMDEEFLAFELDRYLGWPGQAPSYKIGERLWHRLRDDYAAQVRAAGEEFDLAAFHRRALDVGSVGMDTLRRSLLR